MTDIALVHLDDCPHWETAFDRLREAMTTLGLDPTRIRLVGATTRDAPSDFPGSPTILVDNLDLFPTGSSVGPACRRYHTGGAIEGAPSRDAIVTALRQRLEDRTSSGADAP